MRENQTPGGSLASLLPTRPAPAGPSVAVSVVLDDAADAEPAAAERAKAGDDRRGAGRGVAPRADGEHGEEGVAASREVVGPSRAQATAASRPTFFAISQPLTRPGHAMVLHERENRGLGFL
jgi:hypothetical protein